MSILLYKSIFEELDKLIKIFNKIKEDESDIEVNVIDELLGLYIEVKGKTAKKTVEEIDDVQKSVSEEIIDSIKQQLIQANIYLDMFEENKQLGFGFRDAYLKVMLDQIIENTINELTKIETLYETINDSKQIENSIENIDFQLLNPNLTENEINSLIDKRNDNSRKF